jgi:hypothetical protein
LTFLFPAIKLNSLPASFPSNICPSGD